MLSGIGIVLNENTVSMENLPSHHLRVERQFMPAYCRLWAAIAGRLGSEGLERLTGAPISLWQHAPFRGCSGHVLKSLFACLVRAD